MPRSARDRLRLSHAPLRYKTNTGQFSTPGYTLPESSKHALTLPLPLGRVATFTTGRLLQVVGLRATAATQRVRLIPTLSKRGRSLRLQVKGTDDSSIWQFLHTFLTFSVKETS